jgi:hypothetical protein
VTSLTTRSPPAHRIWACRGTASRCTHPNASSSIFEPPEGRRRRASAVLPRSSPSTKPSSWSSSACWGRPRRIPAYSRAFLLLSAVLDFPMVSARLRSVVSVELQLTSCRACLGIPKHEF